MPSIRCEVPPQKLSFLCNIFLIFWQFKISALHNVSWVQLSSASASTSSQHSQSQFSILSWQSCQLVSPHHIAASFPLKRNITVSSTSKTSPLSRAPRSLWTPSSWSPTLWTAMTTRRTWPGRKLTGGLPRLLQRPRRFLRLDPCLCLRLPSLRVLDHLSTLGFLLLVGSFLFFQCVIVFRHNLYSLFT